MRRIACSTKLLEVPNRGPWAKSLTMEDYSWLFWSDHHKLTKYKYVSMKWCSTISLSKKKYFRHFVLTWSWTSRKLWVQLVYLFLLWRVIINRLFEKWFCVFSIAPEIELIDVSWTCDDPEFPSWLEHKIDNKSAYKIFLKHLYDSKHNFDVHL